MTYCSVVEVFWFRRDHCETKTGQTGQILVSVFVCRKLVSSGDTFSLSDVVIAAMEMVMSVMQGKIDLMFDAFHILKSKKLISGFFQTKWGSAKTV